MRKVVTVDTVIQTFAAAVADMYLAKRGRGYAPDAELEEFAQLLINVDWNTPRQPHPPLMPVPGLRHLPAAIANATHAGLCPVLEALRTCVGLVPWETFYAPTEWSTPFLNDFASGELIGPAGYIPNRDISLGLFILGPHVVYTEHAHASTEIYYVLGGRAAWTHDHATSSRWFYPGDLVFTKPHQRHEIRTGSTPLLIAWTWKEDPAAGSYHYEHGPWKDGQHVYAPLRSRRTRQLSHVPTLSSSLSTAPISY